MFNFPISSYSYESVPWLLRKPAVLSAIPEPFHRSLGIPSKQRRRSFRHHSQNNLLKTLKIETCQNLTSINCSQNSLEGELDLSSRTELRKIDCGNTFLTKLNLTDCTKIETLNCNNANFSELDVTGQPAMTELNCRDNTLTTLDVSNNLNLETLYCQGNPLTKLWLAEGQSISTLVIDNPDAIDYK